MRACEMWHGLFFSLSRLLGLSGRQFFQFWALQRAHPDWQPCQGLHARANVHLETDTLKHLCIPNYPMKNIVLVLFGSQSANPRHQRLPNRPIFQFWSPGSRRPRHTVHDAMAELVVYGRESCSACKRFRGSCEHHGIIYRCRDLNWLIFFTPKKHNLLFTIYMVPTKRNSLRVWVFQGWCW